MGQDKMKLTYFNAKGRGEVTRQLFKLASVDFIDDRIEFSEWSKLKPTTPFGQIPVLTLPCGTRLCQSLAIEYYLAKKFGLLIRYIGKDITEEAKIIMIVGCIEDILKPVFAMFIMNPVDKEKTRLDYEQNKIVENLKKIEILFKANKENSGYFVGKKLSIADLKFYSMLNYFEVQNISYCLKPHAELNALKGNISKLVD